MERPSEAGGSLLETALVLPLLIVMLLFAVDYGYFFMVTTNLVTASRNAVLYSTQGFSSPAQQVIPTAGTAGSLSDTSGVAGVAGGDFSAFTFTTGTTPSPQISVCTKSNGVNSVKNAGGTVVGYNTSCTTYPSGSLAVTPDTDPESMNGMLLQRVDVVYQVNFPISLHLFQFNLTPPGTFRWQVEMRAID